jgi:hypothetical protein
VLILGEAHLRAVLTQYQVHYNTARPRRGNRRPGAGRVIIAELGQLSGLPVAPTWVIAAGPDIPGSAARLSMSGQRALTAVSSRLLRKDQYGSVNRVPCLPGSGR